MMEPNPQAETARKLKRPRHRPASSGVRFLTAAAGIVVAAVCLVAARPGERVLRLTHVANEGVHVSTGARAVLIDALFDAPNPAYAAPAPDVLAKLIAGEAPFAGIELLLVTHNHPDHFRVAVVDRFLVAHPRVVMMAPADLVRALRDSAGNWPSYAARVRSIDLRPGERTTEEWAGGRVLAFRTLHGRTSESPMNLMYLVEMDGWTVFHEGDSDSNPESFRAVVDGGRKIDLALVHFWFPFVPAGQQIVDEVLRPTRVGLIHMPLEPGQFTPQLFASLTERFTLLSTPGQVIELRN